MIKKKRNLKGLGFCLFLVIAATILVAAITASPAKAFQPTFTTEPYSWIPESNFHEGVTLSNDVYPGHLYPDFSDPDDDVTSDIQLLNFPLARFIFFGKTFPSVYICTNGWLSFNYSEPFHTSLPLNGAIIAPLLDDLTMGSGSKIKHGWLGATEPYSRFVVTWENFYHSTCPTSSPSTFQAILDESGKITFNYKTVGKTDGVIVGVNRGNWRDGYSWSPGSVPYPSTTISTIPPDLNLIASLGVDPIPTLTKNKYLKVTGSTDFSSSLAFSLNGNSVQLSFTPIPEGRSFTTPTVSLSEGLNDIRVTASKLSDSLSKSYSVRLDSISPLLSVNRPAINSYFKGSIPFRAYSSDSGSGISNVSAYVDSRRIAQLSSPVSGNLYSKTIPLLNGRHTLVVKSTDKAGNVTTSPARLFYVDTFKPRFLSLILPAKAKVGSRIGMRFTLKESFNTTIKVWAKIYSGGSLIRTLNDRSYNKTANTSGYLNTMQWDGKNGRGRVVGAGRYRVYLYALDRAGNREFSPRSAYVIFNK